MAWTAILLRFQRWRDSFPKTQKRRSNFRIHQPKRTPPAAPLMQIAQGWFQKMGDGNTRQPKSSWHLIKTYRLRVCAVLLTVSTNQRSRPTRPASFDVLTFAAGVLCGNVEDPKHAHTSPSFCIMKCRIRTSSLYLFT